MKAVVLAGGLGTRIRPFSFSIPKPLLPVGQKSILEILLKNLAQQGVKEAILAIGYRADLIRAYVHQLKIKGITIRFVEENKRMGTAGPLVLANRYLKPGESFFVMNADILTKLPFRELWKFHHKYNPAITLAIRPYHYQLPFGVVETESRLLKSIVEKPKLSFMISSGIYCMNQSTLALIPKNKYSDIPDVMTKILSNGGKIATYSFTSVWKAIEELGDFKDIRPEEWV